MSKLYDMDELAKCGEFDALRAAENYGSQQLYFDKLTDFFTEGSYNQLCLYNPTIIVHIEDIRKNFLSDLEVVKDMAAPLEMTLMLYEINNLKNAAYDKREKELSDGFVKLSAAAKITSNRVSLARLPDTTADNADNTIPVILAVDDKPELLSTITGMLENSYKIIAVTSGKAAMKVIEKHTPELFLLDIEMPEMDGYELARLIRTNAKFKMTPILFLTSKNTKNYVMAAIEHGGDDYILKPVQNQILLNKIEHNLSKDE